MPSTFAQRVLSVLKGRRLTRAEYVGLLGQLYHFSAAAQVNLRLVIDRINDPALSTWFVRHAREERGHHRWAEEDLRDLGETIPLPLPATLRLIRHMGRWPSGPGRIWCWGSPASPRTCPPCSIPPCCCRTG